MSQWGQTPKASEPSGATDGSLLFMVMYIGNNLEQKAQDTAYNANIR